MDTTFIILIPIAYAIIETAEKFGLNRKYAHLLAIPLGILLSYLGTHTMTIKEYTFYGILIGLGSVGACDTLCNAVDVIKSKKESEENNKDKK